MRNFLYILIASSFMAFCFGCNTQKNEKVTNVLEGDLYFRWFRTGSLYSFPEDKANTLIEFYETDFPNDSVKKANSPKGLVPLLEWYETLKKNDLVYAKYIELQITKDSTCYLFLNDSDYDRFIQYDLKQLQENIMKIHVKAEFNRLDDELIYCTKLLNIEKVTGETHENQDKFKIENYR